MNTTLKQRLEFNAKLESTKQIIVDSLEYLDADTFKMEAQEDDNTVKITYTVRKE